MNNQLTLENVEMNFKKKKVLDGISCSLDSGIYGLLGPNGAGKTTLMRCILTLYNCDGGAVLLNGKNVRKLPGYGSLIGYLPQKFGLFKELTVVEIMRYFAGMKNLYGDDAESEIENCLGLVNLEDSKSIKCKKLSGGMVRRVGIAQALLGNPLILLFDEPTAGLDPEERLRFKLLLRKLPDDCIVIISTHIVEDLEAVCEKIIVMNEGKSSKAFTTTALRETARDKVYEVPVSLLDTLKGNYYTERQYERNDEIFCRVLSPEKQPFDLLEPALEDGYLCHVKNF